MEISLNDILNRIDLFAFSGDRDTLITEIVALDHGPIHASAIFWCSDNFREKLRSISVGTVIISQKTYEWLDDQNLNNSTVNWVVVENPRSTFSHILSTFFYQKETFGTVATSAKIHPNVSYNPTTVIIGENVVIEDGVVLGDEVKIGHNTVILARTIVGNKVKIGNNSTIGGVGFGYEMDASGHYQAIPHIGNVVLKDRVEIGNSVAIDRAVLGSTLLMENVKVDNLVHIAHGVLIGRNSLIIANAMVAGSCEIGENVWVSPSASIIQKVKIGDNAVVGLGSVVLKDVEKDAVMVGVPAKNIKQK